MNILILTYGTRGDVQPYIALGKGLLQAGHQVILATSERFRNLVETAGLQYEYMNDDLLAMLETPQGQNMLENTNNVFDVVRHTLTLIKQVGPSQQALVRESWNAAQQSNPDIILFHPKAFAAPSFAEKLGIPVVMTLVVPGMVPTAECPNMMLPDLKLGGRYNRMTYTFINKLIGLSVGKHVKAWRLGNGLPKTKGVDLLHTTGGEPIPVLHGFSELVFPQPHDWPKTASICGYWVSDECDSYSPSRELEAFLAAGSPPVYVGFGSMAGRDPERLGRIVIEALQKAGARGILATGWGGLKAETVPDTIFKIGETPHTWLFPRMTAIVHHGGAGTTGAALRAGKPSVVVPFFGDQPFWGRLAHTLGVGSCPIPQKKLTVENLAAAIKSVTTNPLIRERASNLGEKILNDDGIGNAVASIDEIIGSSSQTLHRTK